MVVTNTEGKREVLNFPNTKFQCYGAGVELIRPHVLKLHNHNFNQVSKATQEGVAAVSDLFDRTCPPDTKVLRFHAFGDFFSKTYMWGVLKFARLRPELQIYGYTKCVKWWRESLRRGYVPENVRFVMSKGGGQDAYIGDLPYAQVVFNPGEADQLGLPLNMTDVEAYRGQSSALLIHGMQPLGSYAGKCSHRWRSYTLPKSVVS
jgi:hypothetical protein